MRTRSIVAVIAIAIALALFVEWMAPQSRGAMAIFAAFCGAATWIVPGFAFFFYPRPRTSLGVVGFMISLFVYAACFSAMGLPLAIAALLLGEGANWARLALFAILAFWISLVAMLALESRTGPVSRNAPSDPTS